MIRQQCWFAGRLPGRRGPGWRWVGLWLEVDSSAPCGRCEDATRAVRSWRDCEQWSWGCLCCLIVQEGGSGLEGQAAEWWSVGQGDPAAARAPLVRALRAEAMTCHKQPRSRSKATVECSAGQT